MPAKAIKKHIRRFSGLVKVEYGITGAGTFAGVKILDLSGGDIASTGWYFSMTSIIIS